MIELYNTINQHDIIDIYRVLHITPGKDTFFSCVCE